MCLSETLNIKLCLIYKSHSFHSFYQLYITNKTAHFCCKSEHAMQV